MDLNEHSTCRFAAGEEAEIEEETVPCIVKRHFTCNHTWLQIMASMTNQHLSDTYNYAHLGMKRQRNMI